jgi:hypothetical protein
VHLILDFSSHSGLVLVKRIRLVHLILDFSSHSGLVLVKWVFDAFGACFCVIPRRIGVVRGLLGGRLQEYFV